MNMKTLLAHVFFALLVAACGSDDRSGPASGADVDLNGDWVLVDGIKAPSGYPITLSINGHEAGGTAACNGYGGTVNVNGATVVFSSFNQTEMGCEPEVMAAEETFLSALAGIETVEMNGDRMTLIGSGARLGFDRAVLVPVGALVDSSWLLETVVSGDTASNTVGDPATLVLHADGRLEATTGCRSITGSWIENGPEIVVPEMSAAGECPAGIATQDSQVVTVLEGGFIAEVSGDLLTLTARGDDGLIYRLQP